MIDKKYVLWSVIIVILVGLLIFYFATPSGRKSMNRREEAFIEADNETKYATKKAVEDTARTMIVSYMTDKLYWEQYKTSENANEREWAGQARFRANKTAVSYNEYILKNSRVWEGNIPKDIMKELPIIGGE